jgi:hypothetical protein
MVGSVSGRSVSFRIGGAKLQPKIGPGGRTMVKSLSHGAGSSMAATVASMVLAAFAVFFFSFQES